MMRILIVDDDDLALDALESTLLDAGYDVACARNGRDALAQLRRGDFRLVISDWLMPEMDGLELCRQIRAGDFGGYVYVILLTSQDSHDDLVVGLAAGADEFLTKPFHPGELRMRIRTGARILSLETREVAIFAMAKLAESRDPETGEHLERMRNYSQVLAEQLRLCGMVDADFVHLMYLTSPLHDIGKVGIPDSVLLKPGRLSDREFEIMKSHTTIGAETLAAAERQYPGVAYLTLAKEIALTHHEHFDGTGYPSGLCGEDIPLAGRIVALADVYDALTTKRVYKDAFTHEIARNIILEAEGKQFDPQLVRAFLAAEEEFVATREKLSELAPALS